MASSSSRLVILDPVPSDIEISQACPLLPISEVAAAAGILPDEFEPYGKHAGKVSLGVRDRLAAQPDGYYVVVTGA